MPERRHEYAANGGRGEWIPLTPARDTAAQNTGNGNWGATPATGEMIYAVDGHVSLVSLAVQAIR